ncbi:MAG TPA: hypothetical protein VHZ33_32150 [Trebonia sp.]|nr:hypothetical protein [Trebonia sp.]
MCPTESATLEYRYATPSRLLRGALSLATSGGVTEAGLAAHPYFFTGFLAEPGPAAQTLLAASGPAGAGPRQPPGRRAAAAWLGRGGQQL